MTADPLTYPHDYRILFSGEAKPIVVGGQAINLWAITFLESDDLGQSAFKYGSGDMDVLQDVHVLETLRSLPGWRYEKPSLWNFGEIRAGRAYGLSEDGRRLLVEVLTKVNGLDDKDTTAIATLSLGGVEYRLLDPIAMLKAKCANVRTLKQDDDPPRHDRDHLQIIARCLPKYLLHISNRAANEPAFEKEAAAIVSRAFTVLTDKKVSPILLAEGISPRLLIPEQLAASPIEKIRNAVQYQLPRVIELPENAHDGEDARPVTTESAAKKSKGRS